MRTSILALALSLAASAALGADPSVPAGSPDASIDLATTTGVQMVGGSWRVHDAALVEVGWRSPGPDGQPTGAPNRTHDIEPHAGAADFDDANWEVVAAETLPARRSTGKICFAWYRLQVTVPSMVGDFATTGADLVFDIVVDDYAEVWVDGALPRQLGQTGGTLIAGWNAPNRVLIGRKVQPGQKIQLAVFAVNGPLSAAPGNFIWVRSARLDFYRAPRTVRPEVVPAEVIRHDPELDAIVPVPLVVERLAAGFQFTEGPVWMPDGSLLFSDPNANVIYRWTAAGGVTLFRDQSGYAGADIAEYKQPGSNGLTLDAAGRLTICEHGNRRVTRLEQDGQVTVLAARSDGKRLNSPNDLVYRTDGTLYFSDPPFGLPRLHADPRRELAVTAVFGLSPAGRVFVATTDLSGPNGLALSPDEKHLYVANWDEKRKVVMRYDVKDDGTLANGRVFFDMTGAAGEEALDGIKVDRAGHLYVSGPGGIWILAADGRHLGTIRLPELPANFAWGDADGRALYLAARTGLYRMRLAIGGTPPGPSAVAAARP